MLRYFLHEELDSHLELFNDAYPVDQKMSFAERMGMFMAFMRVNYGIDIQYSPTKFCYFADLTDAEFVQFILTK